jgi:hypothetical protein
MMLPDDHIRKMKQNPKAVEDQVGARSRYEPDPDVSAAPDDDPKSSRRLGRSSLTGYGRPAHYR